MGKNDGDSHGLDMYATRKYINYDVFMVQSNSKALPGKCLAELVF